MPRYVALLRGINVGRRNRVAMADLRQVAQSLGHTEVATYIQSGNLLFGSQDESVPRLADALEQAIARTPDGMGRSELATRLARCGGLAAGTARNWATVTRLMAMLDPVA